MTKLLNPFEVSLVCQDFKISDVTSSIKLYQSCIIDIITAKQKPTHQFSLKVHESSLDILLFPFTVGFHQTILTQTVSLLR